MENRSRIFDCLIRINRSVGLHGDHELVEISSGAFTGRFDVIGDTDDRAVNSIYQKMANGTLFTVALRSRSRDIAAALLDMQVHDQIGVL